jgi:hypothetical protein
VCLSCYERLKRYEVRDRAYYEEAWKNVRETPEQREKIIETQINFDAKEWNKHTENGLSAVYTMIEILDAVDEERITDVWHRRRIAFVYDLIDSLDKRLFLPASEEQIRSFMDTAMGYWDKTVSDVERETAAAEMQVLLEKDLLSAWDAKSLLLWMSHKEDMFDWMWYQWFDCVYSCVPKELDDSVWTALFRKHFSEVFRAWADSPTQTQTFEERRLPNDR